MSLRERAYAALRLGAMEAAPTVVYDSAGYAPRWEDNLVQGLPLSPIVADLASGAGRELDGKLRAAHSSAALAINTFGPWRNDPRTLRLAGASGFRSVRFEAICPTGLHGTPPHLDLLAEGETVVGVEAKCTEWMETKVAAFSPSYDRLRPLRGHSPWFAQIESLRARPDRYQFLDAAQLVKHALGLMSCFGSVPVRLLYLYWEPRNAADCPECQRHRAEVDDLARAVRGGSVELISMSYRDLWSEWERGAPPPHLNYLRVRYDRVV